MFKYIVRMPAAHCAAVLLGWLVCAGCGGNPLGRLAVSGQVTFEGEPLEQGTIDFRPLGGDNPVSGGGAIRDGSYRIEAARGLPPGRYEVRIYSSEPDATPPPAGAEPGGSPPAVERIPPQYNVRTEQIVEINRDGPNRFDFDITGRP